MKLITSRDNPHFRELLGLSKSARESQESGAMLLDGDHLVECCREAGVTISLLAIGDSALQRPARRALFEQTAAAAHVVLADPLLKAVSPVATASGLVAIAPLPTPMPLPEEAQTCLLLEGIQDPGNLGTLLRTAAAAGLRHVALSSGSVFPWSAKALRAGMGAQFRLNIHHHSDLCALARAYRGTVIATSPESEASLYQCDLKGPVAWVFGSEGSGISEELARCATRTINIPMPGAMESLNVASAAAVCLFEQARQRGGKS